MKRNTRKGFTGIELVIVIAIIAILAASLIPSFSGLIGGANKTADLQAAREMDAAIKMAALGKDLTPVEVIQILDEAGFEVSNLTPMYKKSAFLWNEDEDCMMLVQNGKIVYPENLNNNSLEGPKTANLSDYLGCFVEEVSTPEALAEALSSGKGVKLTGDVSVDDVIEIKGHTLIDLNGHELVADSGSRPFELNNSSLTIDAEGSTIVTDIYGLVNIKAGACSLTINGGTFTANTDNGAFIKVRPGAEKVDITLNNVTYTDESEDGFIINGNGYLGDLNVNVNGGSYKAQFGFQAKMGTFKDVTIETAGYGIYVSRDIATVEGCTITTGNADDNSVPATCVMIANMATVNVNGCTLTSGVASYGVTNTGGTIIATGNSGANTPWSTSSMNEGATATITVDNVVVLSK